MTKTQMIYRIIFYNQDSVYEMYCGSLSESSMFGFLEIGDLRFGTRNSVVVDPGEERLKTEFMDVKRFYIPSHSIIRIDEVSEEGIPKAKFLKPGEGNISPFPQHKPSKGSTD